MQGVEYREGTCYHFYFLQSLRSITQMRKMGLGRADVFDI